MELVVPMYSKMFPSDWVIGFRFLFFVGAGDRTQGLAHALFTSNHRTTPGPYDCS